MGNITDYQGNTINLDEQIDGAVEAYMQEHPIEAVQAINVSTSDGSNVEVKLSGISQRTSLNVAASTRPNLFVTSNLVVAGSRLFLSIDTNNIDAWGKTLNVMVYTDSWITIASVQLPCKMQELQIPTGITRNQLLLQGSGAISTAATVLDVEIKASKGLEDIVAELSGIVQEEIIYVSTGGNDATADGSPEKPFATIFAANQSITDNSATKRYKIKVLDGIYDDLKLRYAGSTPTSYEGVLTKNFVTYEGNVEHPENVVLMWDGAYGYEEGIFNYDNYGYLKCLFHVMPAMTTAIKGFTLEATNTRYCLHIETSGSGMGSDWLVSDCIFKWHGVPSRGITTPCIGTGCGFFEKGKLLRCRIINDTDETVGWRNHDSAYRYDENLFHEGAEITLESCDFGAGGHNTSVTFRTIVNHPKLDGYNIVKVINCVGISTFSHSEGSGITNSWAAEVKFSKIDTNSFNS